MLNFIYFIRAIAFYCAYAVGIVVIGIAGVIFGFFLERRQLYVVVSRYNVYVLWLARYICGIRYVVEGRENIPEQPCLVVSNHQSAWETYLLGIMFCPQTTVLKQELTKIPFFGWAVKRLDPIALDRSKPAQALKQLLKQGKSRLANGSWVVIYPEGTRIRPGHTGKYNKGAASLATYAKYPVLPIAHNAGKCWPAGRISKYPGEIVVRIGPLIDVQGRNTSDVHQDIESWIRQNAEELSH